MSLGMTRPVIIVDEDECSIERSDSIATSLAKINFHEKTKSPENVVRLEKDKYSPVSNISDTLQLSSSLSSSRRSILKRASSYVAFSNDELQHSQGSVVSSCCGNMRRSESKLSFTSIEIREYSRVLGDNPSAFGPPISLDWNHHFDAIININEYEDSRPTRRKMHQLRMGPQTRLRLLKCDAGVTDDEIHHALKETKKIQKSRSLSDLTSPFWRIEHMAQSAKRKIIRKIKVGSRNIPITPYESSLQKSISMSDIRDELDDSNKSAGSDHSSELGITF